jgi:uncharacterized membrane protein YgdD (TMEM256/DUF423 family)
MLILSIGLVGLGVVLLDEALFSTWGLFSILCGTILFCGACIVEELRRLRRDMGKYITKAVRAIQNEMKSNSQADEPESHD